MRYEFQTMHGFRKYFRVNSVSCEQHAHLDTEVLLGHKFSYYTPPIEHMNDVYVGSLSQLITSEAEEVRAGKEAELKEQESRILSMEEKLKNLELHVAASSVLTQSAVPQSSGERSERQSRSDYIS